MERALWHRLYGWDRIRVARSCQHSRLVCWPIRGRWAYQCRTDTQYKRCCVGGLTLQNEGPFASTAVSHGMVSPFKRYTKVSVTSVPTRLGLFFCTRFWCVWRQCQALKTTAGGDCWPLAAAFRNAEGATRLAWRSGFRLGGKVGRSWREDQGTSVLSLRIWDRPRR